MRLTGCPRLRGASPDENRSSLAGSTVFSSTITSSRLLRQAQSGLFDAGTARRSLDTPSSCLSLPPHGPSISTNILIWFGKERIRFLRSRLAGSRQHFTITNIFNMKAFGAVSTAVTAATIFASSVYGQIDPIVIKVQAVLPSVPTHLTKLFLARAPSSSTRPMGLNCRSSLSAVWTSD